MSESLCPIWGSVAEFEPKTGDFDVVDSPRAGGSYYIGGSDIAVLQNNNLSDLQKALLTSELVSERISGNDCPKISEGFIKVLKDRTPLRYGQKMDRLFRWFSFERFEPGLELDTVDNVKEMQVARAWMEDTTGAQLEAYLKLLVDEGYLSQIRTCLTLTSKGCERLEQFHSINGESQQAFVAMWFGDEMKSAYDDGIRLAIQDSGYEPMRIDRKEHNNKIDDEIISEIRRSRFVVADFTSGYVGEGDSKTLIARGGVYYEAGFAQGLGIPIIWTCHKDCIDNVHFDTRQYAHIVWTTPEDLKDQLAKRIGAIIGWGPKAIV